MDLRPRDRVTIECPTCEGVGGLTGCDWSRPCWEGACGHDEARLCPECDGSGSVEVAAEDVL